MKIDVENFNLTLQEENVLVFCLYNENTSKYLIWMRDKEVTQLEKSVYTEINDQFFSGYGLQKRIIFDGQSLHVILNEKGVEKLNLERLEIIVKNAEFDSESLENSLRKFFSDSALLKIEK